MTHIRGGSGDCDSDQSSGLTAPRRAAAMTRDQIFCSSATSNSGQGHGCFYQLIDIRDFLPAVAPLFLILFPFH